MSTDLPTEEDILAMLVLYGARPVTTNADATDQTMERIAWNAAVADLDKLGDPRSVLACRRITLFGSLEAAIADSERRLEVERARDAVLHRVRHMSGYLTDLAFVRDIAEDGNRLIDAEDAVEVSRHGGYEASVGPRRHSGRTRMALEVDPATLACWAMGTRRYLPPEVVRAKGGA